MGEERDRWAAAERCAAGGAAQLPAAAQLRLLSLFLSAPALLAPARHPRPQLAHRHLAAQRPTIRQTAGDGSLSDFGGGGGQR